MVQASEVQRNDRLEEAARIEAARVEADLERLVVEIQRLALLTSDAASFRVAAQIRLAQLDEVTAIALANLEGDRLVVRTVVPNDTGPLVTDADLFEEDRLRPILTRAVFEADATAGSPFEIDGHDVLTVVAPLAADVVGPEQSQRASVTGAIVATVDASRLLGRWPGSSQLVATGGGRLRPTASGNVYDEVVQVTGRFFTLRLDAPAHHWPASAWFVLGAGSALSLLVATTLHVQLGRRRRAEAQATERSLQLTRIADAGARLQQSLDISVLLPMFAVSLAEDFDLRSVSISLLDDGGEVGEAFVTGDLREGSPVEIPLRRGWRSVGLLSVRAGRELDRAERTSLQALGDLLAVALSNARLYEREQASAARLRDLDALKNAFLGTVSHELRTSMTAIMGFGELLSDAWDTLDDPRRREIAGRIRRSAGSLRHLVDDLLDFARLEQERLRVSLRNVDLAGVVRQTIESLSPLLGHHELDLRVPESVPAWADPVAIERILANLVSNAAKYSPDGTTVTVTVEPAGSTARLVVSDEGPGIPEEERVRIFARFYRLDTPEAVRTRGAGIGLAILRDFADRSGATVTVDDAPGGGARFTVDFPVEPIQLSTEEATVAVVS